MFGYRWNTSDIPDQTGRVVVVTGANSGIGFEAAKALAEKDATVILAVRDRQKGELAKKYIHATYPVAKVEVQVLDLASLDSIRTFCETLNDNLERLDLLINNAGVMIPPFSRTEDGFELQFGVNHLGHFALTAQLFDLIASTHNSRVVTVSSVMHKMGKLDLDDLNWETRKYRRSQAYADSKLANLYFTHELARRLQQGDYITRALAAHPGWTATNLQQHTPGIGLANPLFGQKPAMGALPTLRAAVDEDVSCGDYFGPDGLLEMRGHPKKVSPSRLSRDPEIAVRLWTLSEELTGIDFPVS